MCHAGYKESNIKRTSVPVCKNISNGGCRHGENNCWFIHIDIKEVITNEIVYGQFSSLAEQHL